MAPYFFTLPFSQTFVLFRLEVPCHPLRTFADWCLTRANLIPEAKHTVDVLLEKAETNDCDAADRKLSSLTELYINHDQISDIKPLASLTNLTQLVLCFNEIGDIKPLVQLGVSRQTIFVVD